MSSRIASGVDQSINPVLTAAAAAAAVAAAATTSPPPPPPPPHQGRPPNDGTTNTLFPSRRDHIRQPPALTTALSGLQYQGGLVSAVPTPSSTLSSPFSQAKSTPYTPYAPSPGGASRGTSPMASRYSGGYATAYDPREWGPVAGSPQIGTGPLLQLHQHSGQSRLLHRSDQPAAPPPYSPRRQEPLASPGPGLIIPPVENASPVPTQYNTPVSAFATLPDGASDGRQTRSRPASAIYGMEGPIVAWPSALPPPPPPVSHAAGSASGTAVSRPDASMTTFSVVSRGKQVAPTALVPQYGQTGTPYNGHVHIADAAVVPPSSRRAVSTSAIDLGGVSSRTNSRSGSRSPTRQTTWEPGMSLPGPPPGPPPSSSRSQSATGAAERLSRQTPGPAIRSKTRLPPQMGTLLGPVPPTPAGWIDASGQETESVTDSTRTGSSNTFSPVEITSSATPSSSHSDVASTFFQVNAQRDSSTKGIRERRSESRSTREIITDKIEASSPSINPRAESMSNITPADLKLPIGGSALSRRRTITKSAPRTPRSSRSATMEDQLTSASSRDLQMASATASSRNTPRPDSAPYQLSVDNSIQTPPFSPGDIHSPRLARNSTTPVPPKSLPTPPLQYAKPPMSLTIPPSNLQIRPISHILHMPNDTSGIPAPLSPRRLPSSRTDTTRNRSDHDSFVRDSLDRAKAFLEKEQNAGNDEERLRVFSEYILAESRIRRRRYAPAYSSFDARQTRERLFELNIHAPRRSSGLQETTIASPMENPPSPHPLSQLSQRRTEPTQPDQGRPDSMWWNGYQPALSPIASMSMNDERSSRGRAPSRWWESQTGSESGGGGGGGGVKRVERSKRESKYMGLPLHEAQLAMEGAESSDPAPSQSIYGPNEYPPEKVGWHEPEPSTTPAMPPPLVSPRAAIDVSRLVTLPPPYPRHYPAVQNQHPDLLSYRTLVRTVSDLTALTSRRARYHSSNEALLKESLSRVAENRRNFRINIQAQIQDGSISYAEAAEAEAAMKTEEKTAETTRVQAEFDSFQDVVLNPLHDLLIDRIAKTTHHIDELRGKLFNDAQLHNPNETQSAGDERPELLEQLTQLKWLFEAREQLHREVFHLLTERNEKYQAIVTLPYQQSGNKEAKIRETTAFFRRDTQDRTIAFEEAVLARHQAFLAVIEENVLRGVEAQLSAFWDIAPGLLAICQKIPEQNPSSPGSRSGSGSGGGRGSGGWKGIQIPHQEVEENPSYRQFPMQYLYSLLLHAERSTYQFIESQVNLLCLLHEARTGVMAAGIRCWEVGRLAEGSSTGTGTGTSSMVTTPLASPAAETAGGKTLPPAGGVQEEVQREAVERRQREERALTAELKDRVATVEGQWTEALGSAIVGTRERIKGWLVEEGGWDKELLEDGE